MRPHAAADGLTDRQRAFIAAYLANGRNGTAAYRGAYDAAGMQPKTINKRASEELQKPAVAAAVAEADRRAAEATRRVMERYAISQERLAEELSYLAFTRSTDVLSWSETGVSLIPSDQIDPRAAAAVVSISETLSKDGRTLTAKLADKRQALMDLAKLNGWITEKAQVSGEIAIHIHGDDADL